MTRPVLQSYLEMKKRWRKQKETEFANRLRETLMAGKYKELAYKNAEKDKKEFWKHASYAVVEAAIQAGRLTILEAEEHKTKIRWDL